MLLIDGHNLMGRTPGLSLSREEEGREALLRRVGALGGGKGGPIVVVFDGNRPGAAHEERFGAVRVVYSPAGGSADDEILKRAETAGPKRVTVVTSDRELARRAQWAGCRVESCEEYRKRLSLRQSRVVPEKPEPDPGETDAWLAAFKSSRSS